MNPNKFANQKMQQLGQNLFQGEEMAQQIANKQLDQPIPPPGPYGDMNPIMNKNSREARRQERKNIRMANKGLRSSRRERAKDIKAAGGPEEYSVDGYHKGEYNKRGVKIDNPQKRYSKKNPPDGSDASFGISGYVNDKEQFKSALNQGKKSKYKMVNVQDLEDMGAVKSDKKGKYVVNSDEMKTGTGRDTLRLPRGSKHYTGKPYKVGQLIDESDFEEFGKKVNKK